LLELPLGLTAAELAGGFGLPDARPLASVIELSFLRRVQSLPVQTQRLLRPAAAEPVGDVTLLWQAGGSGSPPLPPGYLPATSPRSAHPTPRSVVIIRPA
jgi:hypothetical protein